MQEQNVTVGFFKFWRCFTKGTHQKTLWFVEYSRVKFQLLFSKWIFYKCPITKGKVSKKEKENKN